jgi:hypothetical protein
VVQAVQALAAGSLVPFEQMVLAAPGSFAKLSPAAFISASKAAGQEQLLCNTRSLDKRAPCLELEVVSPLLHRLRWLRLAAIAACGFHMLNFCAPGQARKYLLVPKKLFEPLVADSQSQAHPCWRPLPHWAWGSLKFCVG